jgi:hypothetical protein
MEIVELLKFIGIIYLVIALIFGLLSRYSALALSKVSNICSTMDHSNWTDYIINKQYLQSANNTERRLGKLYALSGVVLRYVLISIPFTVFFIASYIVYWLVVK